MEAFLVVTVTSFQQRVYDAVRQIPRGKVASYATIAAMIGCRSPRAVGQALRCNPYAPEVPCHRVICSDGRLGGFMGKTEGERWAKKRELLAQEGVLFDHDKLLELSNRWEYDNVPKKY